MDQVTKDKRFAHIVKDNRFHKIPREFRKVKIDNRFKSMFKDKRFKTKYQVDKRGKPVETSTNENLKNYYELDSSDDDDNENDDDKDKQTVSNIQMDHHNMKSDIIHNVTKRTQDANPSSSSESESDDESSVDKNNEANAATTFIDSTSEAIKQGVDLARGEGNISSSSDDEDSDSGVDEQEAIDHKWGELEANAIEAKEITSRLALCNMDWDRLKAQDILILMNSFKPQGGTVLNVKIYPSEYGIKRMEEDNKLGPEELRGGNENSDEDSDVEESDIQQEKLRQYQINRLSTLR